MKAIGLVDVREFDLLDLPEPTSSPGAVIVRAKAIAICGSDLSAYVGGPTKIKPPTVLGHEWTGVIEEVGPGVEHWNVGDRVCVDPTSGCGTCRHCLSGHKNVCASYRCQGMGLDVPGAMSGLVLIPTDRLHRLPDEVDFTTGSLVQPLSIAYHATAHRAGVRSDETVLVLGAGPIGLGVILAAKEAGARVIVVDPLEYRRELASKLGATEVIDPTSVDLQEAVSDLTDGYGADATFEAVGGSDDAILTTAVRATSAGGRIAILGLKLASAAVPAHEMKSLEKTVFGSQAHPDSFPVVIERIANGSYPADLLISHQIPLSDAPDAFRLLESKDESVVKVVLVP